MLFPHKELLATIPPTKVVRLIGVGLLAGWSGLMHCETFGPFFMSLPIKTVQKALQEREQCLSPLSWCQGFFRAQAGVVVCLVFFAMVCPRRQLWWNNEGAM